MKIYGLNTLTHDQKSLLRVIFEDIAYYSKARTRRNDGLN